MAFFHPEPGAKIPEHSHPHEQMGTVLKGSTDLVIDKDKRVVKVGDVYHISPYIVHSGKGLASPADVLEVFFPPRADLQ
jgi:quercetin dioxygenase-like cupin family protein